MIKNSHNKAFETVRSGYNQIGNLYTKERQKADNWNEINAFTSLLPENAKVLDAGSGTGIPNAQHLVKSGCEVVGIDISETMIEVARKNVPEAVFHRMNMINLEFEPESFDGIISTYAIIHVPREFHKQIIKSFYSILKPQGAMLVSVASWAWEEFDKFMGVKMYWSHFDPKKSQSLVSESGFDIEFARDIETGGEKHHWILARKY